MSAEHARKKLSLSAAEKERGCPLFLTRGRPSTSSYMHQPCTSPTSYGFAAGCVMILLRQPPSNTCLAPTRVKTCAHQHPLVQKLSGYADRGDESKVKDLAGKSEVSFADFAAAFKHAPVPQVRAMLLLPPTQALASYHFAAASLFFLRCIPVRRMQRHVAQEHLQQVHRVATYAS